MGNDRSRRQSLASSQEAHEQTPLWRVLLPLVIVVAALLALVVVPSAITDKNEALRTELREVLTPLGQRLLDLERTTSAELAAARGYALTGDPFFVDRFLSVHRLGNELEAEVDSLAALIGGEVATTSQELLETRSYWAAANFGQTRASFREGMPDHQLQFEATVAATQNVGEALGRVTDAQMEEIRGAEVLRNRIAILLALAALIAAGSAITLGWRLHRMSRRLLRRVREESALRGIAQMMAEEQEPSGALQRIAEEIAHMTDADVVRIKQVDAARAEVAVVASVGYDGTPESPLPLRDSLTERVIGSGELLLSRREQPGSITDEPTLLGIPLVSEGDVMGAVFIERENPFGATEAHRTRLLADMAAVVLRHIRLFNAIRRQERLLSESAAELRSLNQTLEQRVRDRTATVRRLARALTLAEQHEREELAQILHDDLQQMLYALRLNLQSIASRQPTIGGRSITDEIERIEEVAALTIESTRHLTADLSLRVLPGQLLVDMLRWLADHVHERFGFEVALNDEATAEEPDQELKIVIFRVVRELLFNAVKHAQATGASIDVGAANGSILITVADNGVGFDPAANGDRSTIGGYGLVRSRERLALFGGTLNLESAPGAGTRACVSVPMSEIEVRE